MVQNYALMQTSLWPCAGLLLKKMGRTVDPGVAKTILQYLRSQDLHEAWVSNRRPGTWRNVQRAATKAREAARRTTKAAAPPPPTAPRTAGVKRKEAGADGAAGSSKSAAARSSKRQASIGKKTAANERAWRAEYNTYNSSVSPG